MEEIIVEIEALDRLEDPPLDHETIEGAIFVEDAPYALRISKITVNGKYERTYKIVAFCVELNNDRVLLDNNLLIICLWSNILIIDLDADKLIKNIELNCWELFGIFKFKSGYIIHGEDAIRFMNADFEIVWDKWAIDIYANGLVEKDFEVFEDYAIAYDWYGIKHYFDENGEFKTEHYPEYCYEQQ